MDAEVNRIITGIKNDYEASLRRESLIRQAFELQKAKVMQMKEQSIQYNILKREADTNKELYKGLLQRMKEAGVSAGLTVSNIQVVDQAEIPTGPYKPNKKLNLLLAAVVGLFLGMGLAFFFEYLDNTVKNPEDVEQLIRLPSFGMVPEISYERKKRLEKASHPVELVTHGHPKSILSEAYRNIRTSILLSFSEKPPKRTIEMSRLSAIFMLCRIGYRIPSGGSSVPLCTIWVGRTLYPPSGSSIRGTDKPHHVRYRRKRA
jgi:hypothetical protein